MRRKMIAVLLAVLVSGTFLAGEPASAQGGGCAAFGQGVAGLAQSFGPGFGQTAAAGAPLNDTVESEQNDACGD